MCFRNLAWPVFREIFPYIVKSFVKILTYKKFITMNATELVSYPVHVLFLKFSHYYRKWFLENGFTQIWFLTVDFMDN